MYTNLNKDITRMVEEDRLVSTLFLWRIKQESRHRKIPVDVMYHLVYHVLLKQLFVKREPKRSHV